MALHYENSINVISLLIPTENLLKVVRVVVAESTLTDRVRKSSSLYCALFVTSSLSTDV